MGRTCRNGHAVSDHARSSRLPARGIVLLLALAAALAFGSGCGSHETERGPSTTSASATTAVLPVPMDYRQVIPAGVAGRAVPGPLCRRFRQTFAHWAASLRSRLARLRAVPSDDPWTAAAYVKAHHLSQTDNNGAFARRISRLADVRLRELAGRRASYVTGDMVHDFKPHAIDACEVGRAYERVSELASDLDLRVTAILVAASQTS